MIVLLYDPRYKSIVLWVSKTPTQISILTLADPQCGTIYLRFESNNFFYVFLRSSIKNCFNIQGEKIFYLVPPTKTNLDLYQQWLLKPNHHEIFFGDMVKLNEKQTVFLIRLFFMYLFFNYKSRWMHVTK